MSLKKPVMMSDSQLPRHRYRLNANAPEAWKSGVCLERVNLSSEWTVMRAEQNSLKPYLKTPANPNGPVDYEKFNASDLLESPTLVSKVKPIIISKEDLPIIPRERLIEVAQSHGIDTKSKKEQWIRDQVYNKLFSGE